MNKGEVHYLLEKTLLENYFREQIDSDFLGVNSGSGKKRSKRLRRRSQDRLKERQT
jgi:hypothetical protein